MQAEALLDAHGGEGQAGQVLPGGEGWWHRRPQAGWLGDDTQDLSPFDLLHVPALEELADLLAAPLLVLGVAGQVVEQPRQTAGRRVVACRDKGLARGHASPPL